MSVTVAMTTRQLVLLLSSGEVVTVETLRSGAAIKHVVRLANFADHYRLPASQRAGLQLFVIHTYYGIFCKGELRYNVLAPP